jgi:AcrR family transcriptional regulator
MPRRRTTAAATPPRELRARGQRTQQRLLDAGVEVFAKRGYHTARVDDIVKVAKTSHGTFYLYFANKEDLFRALAETVATEMRALADALPPMSADAEGVKALRAWLVSFADLYEHYGPVIRAWTEAEIGESEFGRMGTDVLTEFTRILVDRVQAAAPTDLDPIVASIALVAMIERCNYYVLTRQVQIDRDAMISTLAAVTHAALFGASDSSASQGPRSAIS